MVTPLDISALLNQLLPLIMLVLMVSVMLSMVRELRV